ncbi:response regulator [Aquiflexum sp.]|uniref:response regulator n=1 Tax=Aquiflexum sp. TaxID=1872584 RepID=UPI003593B749
MTFDKPKVFIIDDDPGVVFLHEIIIKESHLTAHPECFIDARKALDYIFTMDVNSSRLLIFLDINMPKMSGWDFLELLTNKIKKADIKVVMVTSSLSKVDREKSEKFPLVIDFWEKPINETQSLKLQEKLESWLLPADKRS